MASPPASHPFMRQRIGSTPSPAGSTPDAPTFASLGPTPNTTRTTSRAGAATPGSDVRSERSATSPLPPPRPGTITRSPRLGDSDPTLEPEMNGKAEAKRRSWGEALTVEAEAEASAPRKLSRWEEKVQGDLAGWRGGHGTPRSSVPQPGQPNSTYYGQPPTGIIGRDLPKEIVRVDREWSLGDICQFSTAFPLELETRLDAATYTKFIESINVPLREAYSVSGAVIDNLIGVLTWWTSLLWHKSHFESELRRAEDLIEEANEKTFHRVGLNILSPRSVALQYLEIEYY
ncbi:hypothetical protein CspHIS471_0405880 [Cutaneotrichosporon sp. HIS471]|nr:hypothetical protein CspHIS471_0405880 [Cutaneotrichosporon sp. HIS471]